MLEKRVSMEDVKKRLRDSDNFSGRDIVAEFASVLADELGEYTNPDGFYISSLKAIIKMKEKRNYSLPSYTSLIEHITDVADKVCSRDFAETVRVVDKNHHSARGDLYPNEQLF